MELVSALGSQVTQDNQQRHQVFTFEKRQEQTPRSWIDFHNAVGSLSVFNRRLTHGVMKWSGLRTPGYVETPGNMALLCLRLQAFA